MAKKIRNGITQKQRKTINKRIAQAIDIYFIRPNQPMRERRPSRRSEQSDGGGPAY